VSDQASEVDLLRRAQAGDPEAFADLQARLEAPIRRFVWRLIGTHPEAEDVLQDSMIAFYLNLDRIQPPEKLRPYIFRIVRNRCYDLLRRRRRFDQISLDEEPVESWTSLLESDDHDQPEEVAQWLLVHLEVRRAMDKLPEAQRQTLILYAEEGLSYEEIAEVMETSLGTIKSRLFHARKTLRLLVSPETLELLEHEFTDQSTTEKVSTLL